MSRNLASNQTKHSYLFLGRLSEENDDSFLEYLFENLESSYHRYLYVSIPIHPREELTRHAHARLLEARTHARTPRENDARAFSRFYWRHAANLVSVREDERTVKGGAERGRNATNFRAARRVPLSKDTSRALSAWE